MAENAQVRRAAFALVGLALLAALGFALSGGPGAPEPPLPGEEAFRLAARRVVAAGEAQTAFGDDALAQALLAKLSDVPAAGGGARVHAQRSAAGTCFLIGLPGQKLSLKERGPFLATAWLQASGGVGEGLVVVALRGKLTVVGVARGQAGGTTDVVSGLAVVPTDLFPLFAAAEAAPETSAH